MHHRSARLTAATLGLLTLAQWGSVVTKLIGLLQDRDRADLVEQWRRWRPASRTQRSRSPCLRHAQQSAMTGSVFATQITITFSWRSMFGKLCELKSTRWRRATTRASFSLALARP